MKADNHYEVAFDAFLRQRGAAVVPVVEARRSYLDTEAVKSPDFLVITGVSKLVVDVKGRKFPGTANGGKPRAVWHNWCEREDVIALCAWATRLGADFRGVLAFTYELAAGVDLPRGTPDVFAFRGRVFLMRGVLAPEYRARMRTRSPRWGTVNLLSDDFRQLVKPFSHFLAPPADAVECEVRGAGCAES